MTQPYDSASDTFNHIFKVEENLHQIIYDLKQRVGNHDKSKLQEPEKSILDESGATDRNISYNSEQEQKKRKSLELFLHFHYKANDHHPEHFEDGINDMNLLQIIEMLADWKAATMRHADGDIRKSVEINAERFGLSPQMARVLMNTLDYLKW